MKGVFGFKKVKNYLFKISLNNPNYFTFGF